MISNFFGSLIKIIIIKYLIAKIQIALPLGLHIIK